MNRHADSPVTQLLQAMGRGDVEASEELFRRVMAELKLLARRQRKGTPRGWTLRTTALVNEAYLRLLGSELPAESAKWENRRHFFFVAARAMHDILVEEARRKAASKRGGGWKRVDVRELEVAIEAPSASLLALDEALQKLEADEPRMAEIVRLRFFAGLTEEETASAMEVSARTVRRDWRYARARLYRDLVGGTGDPTP